jgi:hypothetical protein
MQKGTMMTGIVDGVIQITNVFARVTKKAKEEGVITEKENAYIAGVFTERLKEGNLYIEKVKELLSPKPSGNEQDKLQLLTRMYGAMKAYTTDAKRFEKGFTRLSQQRSKSITDTSEIAKLFKNRETKNDQKPNKKK